MMIGTEQVLACSSMNRMQETVHDESCLRKRHVLYVEQQSSLWWRERRDSINVEEIVMQSQPWRRNRIEGEKESNLP